MQKTCMSNKGHVVCVMILEDDCITLTLAWLPVGNFDVEKWCEDWVLRNIEAASMWLFVKIIEVTIGIQVLLVLGFGIWWLLVAIIESWLRREGKNGLFIFYILYFIYCSGEGLEQKYGRVKELFSHCMKKWVIKDFHGLLSIIGIHNDHLPSREADDCHHDLIAFGAIVERKAIVWAKR